MENRAKLHHVDGDGVDYSQRIFFFCCRLAMRVKKSSGREKGNGNKY